MYGFVYIWAIYYSRKAKRWLCNSLQLILSLILVPGYVGKNCETKLVNCATSVPCLNGGQCLDNPDPDSALSYSCTCQSGYSGASCENNIDDCAISRWFETDKNYKSINVLIENLKKKISPLLYIWVKLLIGSLARFKRVIKSQKKIVLTIYLIEPESGRKVWTLIYYISNCSFWITLQ